jgi:hypothetical protein
MVLTASEMQVYKKQPTDEIRRPEAPTDLCGHERGYADRYTTTSARSCGSYFVQCVQRARHMRHRGMFRGF